MPAIVQKDEPLLREKAREVSVSDITSPRIQKIIARMKSALVSQADGVAIAAPQIGESLRIFIVSEKVFDLSQDVEERRMQAEEKDPASYGHLVFINPVIMKLSRQKQFMEEGCLSVRWFYGKVKRSVKATLRAYDEHGRPIERGASGLLSQVFQHEVDHLNGTLFIDKAVELRELPPERPVAEHA